MFFEKFRSKTTSSGSSSGSHTRTCSPDKFDVDSTTTLVPGPPKTPSPPKPPSPKASNERKVGVEGSKASRVGGSGGKCPCSRCYGKPIELPPHVVRCICPSSKCHQNSGRTTTSTSSAPKKEEKMERARKKAEKRKEKKEVRRGKKGKETAA